MKQDLRGRIGCARRFAVGFAAWLFAATAAADAEDGNAAVREQFKTAYASASVGTDSGDSAELRGYVLYPYLRAARLEHALARSRGAWNETDDAAARFAEAAEPAPAAQSLRRAWLASLARRESWRAFLERYEPRAATLTLECQHFAARIALDETAALADAIRERWLTGYRLPSECEPAFQWLRAQGGMTDELVAARAGLLLDRDQTSFARIVAARLPAAAAAPLLERASFIESPARMLDAWSRDPQREVPAEVVREAWFKHARTAPTEALARYPALVARAPEREHVHELALALAKGLAWDRRPEALDYFARVLPSELDELGLEWWARSAMWAGDWELVGSTIARMDQAQQSEWSWRYWAARAAEQLGERGPARALYATVLDGDNYYSAMAAARLGERVAPRREPIPFDAAAVDALASTATFVRVRELALTGLRELATNEWHHGYAQLREDQRLHAVHLAARWGMHDVAVALASSHGRFNDYALLYPRPYPNEVAAAVKLTALEPPLLYGVLRQESLFRADGASPAGALGIAQLTPATARETARRWALPAPKRADLFDPGTGIRLGAARVAELLERFDSQVPLALGAYNAGEAAATRWLPPRAIDSDVWIENIPFNETRAYVRRVLWHSLVFRWLETGEPQNARDWLAPVVRPEADLLIADDRND